MSIAIIALSYLQEKYPGTFADFSFGAECDPPAWNTWEEFFEIKKVDFTGYNGITTFDKVDFAFKQLETKS